jgi:hypothetical protein
MKLHSHISRSIQAQSGNEKSYETQVTYTMDANVTWKNSEPKVRHRNSTLARNTYAAGCNQRKCVKPG